MRRVSVLVAATSRRRLVLFLTRGPPKSKLKYLLKLDKATASSRLPLLIDATASRQDLTVVGLWRKMHLKLAYFEFVLFKLVCLRYKCVTVKSPL